ncbi:hypothetical protein AWB75_03192 [Caballeronia catudaia]|uniref:Lipoprotein n=1 Tax=Caballeronia catudaia TaxID=1777136 RepID=A0A158BAU8_9BURK|nr:hypothetical protein AWB75_03192 [Caballeronia catudaia]
MGFSRDARHLAALLFSLALLPIATVSCGGGDDTSS